MVEFCMDGSWAANCAQVCSALHTDLSSVVLMSPLMFEFLVRNGVAENQIGCQHHAKPHDAAFPDVDVLVLLAVSSLKGSHNVTGAEILYQQQLGCSPCLTLVSFSFSGTSINLVQYWCPNQCECWELISGPLQEQYVLLIAEPLLQPRP